MTSLREWLSLPTVEPAEDYGFFGPDSVSWKVWSYPTSLSIGFQRAVVVEELDPALIAAVDKSHGIYDRPRTRYDRTLRYFAMVMFGDTRSTTKAADVLVKIHSKAVGIDPVNGSTYDANDPKSQLWIHLTAWHSILHVYEKYGPGRLTAAEEAQYWGECARAAQLQTCDPADVPCTRESIEHPGAPRPARPAGGPCSARRPITERRGARRVPADPRQPHVRRDMVKDLLDHRISVRQLVYLAIAFGFPYLVIGVIWAATHHDHLSALHGLDKLFSTLGEVVAWPVLLIADVTLR